AQEAIRAFVREYNRRHGATVLLTSHYMADVTALAPRVLIINRGRLLYDGGLTELADRIAPVKRLELVLEREVDRADLERFGAVTVLEDHKATIEVPRRDVARASARLLAALPVADLSITDPPIEEVIARAFAGEATKGVDAAERGGDVGDAGGGGGAGGAGGGGGARRRRRPRRRPAGRRTARPSPRRGPPLRRADPRRLAGRRAVPRRDRDLADPRHRPAGHHPRGLVVGGRRRRGGRVRAGGLRALLLRRHADRPGDARLGHLVHRPLDPRGRAQFPPRPADEPVA